MHFSTVLLTLGLLSQVICSSIMCCEFAPGSKFVILLSFVASAFGAGKHTGMKRNALKRNANARIINGWPTPIDQFPWQISLQKNGNVHCGGVIYSTKIVLTAAHCLEDQKASQLKVRAGATTWQFGGVLIQVASFKMHEKYDTLTMVYDIGFVRLKTPLRLCITIRIIALAQKTPADGTVASVSGWGTTTYGPTSFFLMFVNTKIVSRQKCSSSAFKYGNQIKDTMLCAAFPGRDSCQGDSGGPLVANGVLVGIVSWGSGCADKEYPGVYSDVAVLRPWILKNAK